MIEDPPLSLNVDMSTGYPVLSCVIRIENAVAPEGGFRSVNCVTSSSTVNVNVDLSVAQSFTLTVDEEVTQFTLLNPPSGATAFSILITQDSTGYPVAISAFKDSGGSAITLKFPAGGVVPIVTNVASKSDIYSFKTFDGGSTLFGVVGGQNFA